MTDTEIAYLAGIIDGEGCIGLRTRLKYVTPMLQVSNTKRELLDWIALRLRGTVYVNKEEREGRNRLWSWQIWGANAQSAINKILPYLVIKRKQAELALTVRRYKVRVPGRAVMTQADFDFNALLFSQFKALNKRGTRS